MKAKLVVGSLLAFTMVSNAQWTTSGTNIYNSNTGNVGIGTTAPSQKLDVRGGAIHVVNSSTLPYSFIGRDANPGNDSYFYHRMTTNYHILGSSKNGTGTMRKIGFAIGGSDLEADVKMTIIPNGNVGIGTSAPLYKLHVESDEAAMTSNPLNVNNFVLEPTYQALFSKLTVTTKFGAHAGIYGYDLSNTPAGSYAITGIGVFGKSERTDPSHSAVVNIGVYGKSVGPSTSMGGVFYGASLSYVGDKTVGESNFTPASFGVWASTSKNTGIAGYFNGSAYSAEMYQSADTRLKDEIKPLNEAINKLMLIKPLSFKFKSDEYQNLNLFEGRQMGLNPEELQEVFPELVKEIADVSERLENDNEIAEIKKYKAINYTNLIPLLIAGMQEQQAQLQEQKEENQELKNLVAILQQQSNDLLAKTSDPTGISNLVSQTDGFSMDQNIPNPFSNETLVNYTLPQNTGKAYMAVYDLSGKQIRTFPLNQKGTSSLTISSEKLAAGIYIYSIIADGKVMDSKRMVVADKQ